jgi:hypothetical protein
LWKTSQFAKTGSGQNGRKHNGVSHSLSRRHAPAAEAAAGGAETSFLRHFVLDSYSIFQYLKRRQTQDEHRKSVYKKRRFCRAQASGSRTASPQSHTTPTLHTRKTLTSGRTPDLPVALLRWAAQHRAAALRRWRALSTSMCRERLSFKASAEIDAFLHGSFAGNPIVCQDRLRINNRKRLKTAFLQASAGRLRHGNAVAPWLTRSGSTGPRPGR